MVLPVRDEADGSEDAVVAELEGRDAPGEQHVELGGEARGGVAAVDEEGQLADVGLAGDRIEELCVMKSVLRHHELTCTE